MPVEAEPQRGLKLAPGRKARSGPGGERFPVDLGRPRHRPGKGRKGEWHSPWEVLFVLGFYGCVILLEDFFSSENSAIMVSLKGVWTGCHYAFPSHEVTLGP